MFSNLSRKSTRNSFKRTRELCWDGLDFWFDRTIYCLRGRKNLECLRLIQLTLYTFTFEFSICYNMRESSWTCILEFISGTCGISLCNNTYLSCKIKKNWHQIDDLVGFEIASSNILIGNLRRKLYTHWKNKIS